MSNFTKVEQQTKYIQIYLRLIVENAATGENFEMGEALLTIIHKTQVKKTFSSELLLFYVRRGTVHSDVCGLERQTRTEGVTLL